MNPVHSEPNSEDEASIASSIEAEIDSQEESPLSLWLSGPNEELSRDGQLESEEESTMMLPKKKPKKRLTH